MKLLSTERESSPNLEDEEVFPGLPDVKPSKDVTKTLGKAKHPVAASTPMNKSPVDKSTPKSNKSQADAEQQQPPSKHQLSSSDNEVVFKGKKATYDHLVCPEATTEDEENNNKGDLKGHSVLAKDLAKSYKAKKRVVTPTQVRNLASGLSLATRTRLREGDLIEIDGLEGTVRDIALLRVAVRSVDGIRQRRFSRAGS